MKINNIIKYVFIAFLLVGAVACKNPLKDFDLQISTEVIKHTATVKVVDVNGTPIAGATVALYSGETQDVYNQQGYKDFKLVDGQVVFGLDPNITVVPNTQVRFRIEVKAPGYNDQLVPVTISTSGSTGINVVTLIKPSQSSGAEELQATVDLAANGSLPSAASFIIPVSGQGSPQASLTIPAGTQFKDASGNVIQGGSVLINIAVLDTDNESVNPLLPGGGLTTDAVVLQGGRTAPGTFSTAWIVRINMYVNGVAVRQFSQPISVGIPLPADYVSPITGQAIQAGQSFELFSNSATTNTWTYEQAVTVAGNAGTGYIANFTTDHLTYYLVGEFGEACATGAQVNLSGDWMAVGSTYPVTVEAIWGSKVIFKRVYSVNQNASSLHIDGLPAGTTLRFKNAAGNLLTESPLAACGQATAVVLPNPGNANNPLATLQLYVRCPNKVNTITLLPTFQMYYRESNGGTYAFLGTVENGLLRTSLLKTDGTLYDFKAYYSTRVKEVLKKEIEEDNTATVGIQPGDIMGEKAGATNLAILTEECDKL